MSEAVPLILLDSGSKSGFGLSWRFSGHIETLQVFDRAEVLQTLAKVEKSAAAGFHAAGFIAYEAAA